MTADADLDEDKKSGLGDYLSAPKKKRKNYTLLALSRKFDPDIYNAIENHIKKNFSAVAMVRPKTPKELSRLFSRQIVGMLIDDEFSDLQSNINLVKSLKLKKNDSVAPVLFLTENPDDLIKLYNKELLPYQEMDNYLLYRNSSIEQILARVSTLLKTPTARRSRRYRVNLHITYYLLRENKYVEGKLVDMSAHGAVLETEEEKIYQIGEQFKIRIPLSRYLPIEYGDYIRVSARVRRVFMGGNKVALSWEHVTEEQFLSLCMFLTEMVNHEQTRGPGGRRS